MPRSKGNAYVGTSGQLAVMSELSWRGYNVALPEIDKGDDIFTLNDETGIMLRVQVKAASGHPRKRTPAKCYSFNVRNSALVKVSHPELYFVFACRRSVGFRFVVVSRDVLNNYVKIHNIGFPGDQKRDTRRFDIMLHDDDTVTVSGTDWTSHLEDWAAWPVLSHNG